MIKKLERIIPPIIFLILIGTVGYFAMVAMADPGGDSTPTPITGVTETAIPTEELTVTLTSESIVTPTDESTATPTDESTDETDGDQTDESTNEVDESQADESTDETNNDQTDEPSQSQTDKSADETDADQTDETTNEADESQADESVDETDDDQTVESTDETTEDQSDEPTNETDESQTDETTDETDDTSSSQSRPTRAVLVAVQSNRQSHTLDMIGFDGLPIRNGLHLHAGAPAWSPDGRQIAFVADPSINRLGEPYTGPGIWVVNDQGGNPRRILAIDHVKNMTWSPDGTKLAFEINPPNLNNPEIRVIDPRDGAEVSRFAGEHPTWSPNSQLLAIRGCIPDCGIWQVNFDGTPVQQLTTDGSDSYPTWSPWDNYLAFARRVDNNWEIYRLGLADGQLLRLTNHPATDTTPVFGPNGQEIYFLTDENTAWRIKAVWVDGSSERQVREGVGPSDEWGLARPAVR